MRKDYWIHKLPGGVIGETGPHPMYISLAFLGSIDTVDVNAQSYLEHPWAKFDEFRIELAGKNGMSSIMVSYSGNRYAAEVQIFGAEGAIYVDLQSMLCIKYGKKENLKIQNLVGATFSGAYQSVLGVFQNGFKVCTGNFKVGHDIVIEKFVDSVLYDTPLPVTGDEGRLVIKAMEQLVSKMTEKYG
jgi:predicted dehydrogenase